jgi:hypothetical protein
MLWTKSLQPSLIFEGKARSQPSEWSILRCFKGQSLFSISIIGLGWRGSLGPNAAAYLYRSSVIKRGLKTLGANVIKPFTAVSYDFL